MAPAAVTGELELDDMQGLLLRGYRDLHAACFLVYGIEQPTAARTWLADIGSRLTSARERPADVAVNLAVTVPGLVRLGLSSTSVQTFPFELRSGMASPRRQNILGDKGESAPEHWGFGGPGTPPVHLLLLVYATDDAHLAPLVSELAGGAAAGGLKELQQLETTDIGQVEHFGFRDGVSQPLLEGVGGTARSDQTVKPGELVLGYANEYGLYPTSPRVPASSDPHGVLAPDPSNGSHHDLGRNGSYLVLRQLEQDVRAFWRFADDAARSEDGRSDPVARVRIAAKLVGRWPSGAPLVLAPDADDPALAQENTFRYHAQDAGGQRCPVGAHIRRANPRDSLDPNPGSDGSVAVAKHHRLLRRGREYGSRLTMDQALGPVEAGDDGPRGLHFICLNSNVARQFEFIHQTWVNSPKFADLYDEPDPIVTGGGFFSMPAEPVRRRLANMPCFLRVRGGAYFLLPGLRAIRYLSALES